MLAARIITFTGTFCCHTRMSAVVSFLLAPCHELQVLSQRSVAKSTVISLD